MGSMVLHDWDHFDVLPLWVQTQRLRVSYFLCFLGQGHPSPGFHAQYRFTP